MFGKYFDKFQLLSWDKKINAGEANETCTSLFKNIEIYGQIYLCFYFVNQILFVSIILK